VAGAAPQDDIVEQVVREPAHRTLAGTVVELAPQGLDLVLLQVAEEAVTVVVGRHRLPRRSGGAVDRWA
jgi:hypothetical protein